jgi:hypothetical protein
MKRLLRYFRKHQLAHGSALGDSHLQALLSKLEALSTTIAEMNSSLHAKIDIEIRSLTQNGSSWT